MSAPGCWGLTVSGAPCRGHANSYMGDLCATHKGKLNVAHYRIDTGVGSDEDFTFVTEEAARLLLPEVAR